MIGNSVECVPFLLNCISWIGRFESLATDSNNWEFTNFLKWTVLIYYKTQYLDYLPTFLLENLLLTDSSYQKVTKNLNYYNSVFVGKQYYYGLYNTYIVVQRFTLSVSLISWIEDRKRIGIFIRDWNEQICLQIWAW